MTWKGKIFVYLFIASVAFAAGVFLGLKAAPARSTHNITIGKQKLKGDQSTMSNFYDISPPDSLATKRESRIEAKLIRIHERKLKKMRSDNFTIEPQKNSHDEQF